jgi:hypothetical protein
MWFSEDQNPNSNDRFCSWRDVEMAQSKRRSKHGDPHYLKKSVWVDVNAICFAIELWRGVNIR